MPYSKYERHPDESNTELVARLRPRKNFGCFFTDRLVSLHCALESDLSGDCPGGNTYGPLTPNSAGSGAILSATTTPTPSTITLMASGCPTVPSDLFGVFFYGFAAQQSPFGCGNQLVRSPITRLDPPVPLSATGTAERFVDLSLEPM